MNCFVCASTSRSLPPACRRKKKCSLPKISPLAASGAPRLRHRNSRHAVAAASESLDSIREGVAVVTSANALLAATVAADATPADSSPNGTPPCELSECSGSASMATPAEGGVRKTKPTAKCMPTLYIPQEKETNAPADDEDDDEEANSAAAVRMRRFIESKNRLLPDPDGSQVCACVRFSFASRSQSRALFWCPLDLFIR